MRTEPGKVDGNSLSKVFPDVVEWLILEPLPPPAQEGFTNRDILEHELLKKMLPCPELIEDLPGVELVMRRTSTGWPPIVPLQFNAHE